MDEAAIPEDTAGAYWPEPWSSEDNGSQRWCCATPQGGPGIGPGDRLELLASRDAYATDMLIRRDPGELYALRHGMPLRGGAQSAPVKGWVEKLDPETLEVIASTPKLPGGPYWPGGIGFRASGDLYMVFGCWAHRITPDLEVVASQRLPADRPHNSFVILDGGELATKDCDAPAGRAPSTVSILDPETLEPLAAPLGLPEASIGRLCSDGDAVIAIGTTRVFRILFDRDAGELAIDPDWQPEYGRPGSSYGWDPVITPDHVIWMDNGRNDTDTTMLDSGEAPSPLRLWWARRDDAGAIDSVEISGLPHGTESNPPAWDPVRGVVVAYDAGNAVLAPGEGSPPPGGPPPAPSGAPAARPPLAGAPQRAGVRERPARGRRPGHRRGPRAGRHSVPLPGLPLPDSRIRARHLLPVDDHDRPRRSGLKLPARG